MKKNKKSYLATGFMFLVFTYTLYFSVFIVIILFLRKKKCGVFHRQTESICKKETFFSIESVVCPFIVTKKKLTERKSEANKKK